MKALPFILKLIGCMTLGGILAAIGGNVVARVYLHFRVEPIQFFKPGFAYFVMSLYSAFVGILLGFIIGLTRVGMLYGAVIGLCLSVAIAVWYDLTQGGYEQQVRPALTAFVTAMTLTGLIVARVSQSLGSHHKFE